MKHIHTLLAFLLLTISGAQAQTPDRENFSLGAWEHEIGYTQAVRVGPTLYVSGSTGSGTMPEAIAEAYGAIQRTLAHYGLTFAQVVKENVYTTDIEALKRHAAVRRAFYGKDFPAATWVQVARLYDLGHVIEVEVVAVVPDSPGTGGNRAGK